MIRSVNSRFFFSLRICSRDYQMQGLHNWGTGPRKWVTSFLGLSPMGWKEKKIGIICYRENGKWKSNDCYCYICRLLLVRSPLSTLASLLCMRLKPFPHFSLFKFYGSCLLFPQQNYFPLCCRPSLFFSLFWLPFSLISSSLPLFYLLIYFFIVQK